VIVDVVRFAMAGCANATATAAEIARRLESAGQGVQRVADAPERHGLCVCLDNPRPTRANPLALTPKGRRMLERIESARRGWSESLGRRIGEPVLREISVAVGKRLDGVEVETGRLNTAALEVRGRVFDAIGGPMPRRGPDPDSATRDRPVRVLP